MFSKKSSNNVLSLVILLCLTVGNHGRARDICLVQPSINGLCVSSTLGIVYDVETQHCKYMGCSTDKKLFATLEDCEKICNNSRHRRLRTKYNNKTNNVNREE
ncbi:uncharacterized protein LOC118740888 [Rhagoletis pomonella]|uniref:uncharacterized protein LOC118740888 n=1 Tax=Rhagoletis pomonella TaxID=28610 RepID=UPI00178392A8|nr:uncharacterized protein LOC118740888 [Rhagoletis pomonella]